LFAAQNGQAPDAKGLMDFASVAERSVSFRNFPFRSVWFRNFPKLSVSFRSVPPYFGWFRTDFLLPSAWCLFRSRSLSGVAGSCEAGSCEASAKQDGEAGFAAQNRKCLVLHGLTDFGAVAERSVSFRNFPKLSVSFRFVPEFSVSFRSVPLWAALFGAGADRAAVAENSCKAGPQNAF